jgi:hypothetical protein
LHDSDARLTGFLPNLFLIATSKFLITVFRQDSFLPLKHCPSSSSSLSITKGGASAVTTLNTVLALDDTAATARSPPGQMMVSSRTDRPDTNPTLFHLTLDVPGSTETAIRVQIAQLSPELLLIRGTP